MNKTEKAYKSLKTANEVIDVLDQKRDQLEAAYTELIDKINSERERVEYDLKHEYRNARRYVRAHPEQGVGIAFMSGLVVGVLLGKLLR